ncbi:hypothetical protein Glove_267g12 [Diversispora epigaea]|uniref:Uncharacterized protein n=1 Tax=Diversispora epigaea TaxID=1348612 RepID=A0A397I6N3_9GLOM|nr:hypothetical protein Glove_267g12 [Diversispora epigaea]
MSFSSHYHNNHNNNLTANNKRKSYPPFPGNKILSIEKDQVSHLLFYGPPSAGKTTEILAFARKLYGPSWKKKVLEKLHFELKLNALDDRGINVVREKIKHMQVCKECSADSMTNALRRSINVLNIIEWR